MQDITDRLRAELERPTTAGPDLARAVLAGRAALRRRRLAALGATLAVVIVGGGATAALTAGDDRGRDRLPVTGPSTPGASDHRETGDLDDVIPVAYDDDGTVLVQRGWSVTERIDDPLTDVAVIGGPSYGDSVALTLTKGEEVRWALLAREESVDGDGRGSASGRTEVETEPGTAFPDLATWVAYRVDVITTRTTDDLVVLDDRDRLRPLHGVRVLEQQVLDDLGPDVSDDPVVAARLDVGSEELWVLARRAGADTDLVIADRYPDPETRASMPDFVAYLESVYGVGSDRGNGEGLR